MPGAKAALFTASKGSSYDEATIEAVTFENRQRRVLHRGGTYGRYVMASDGSGYLTYVNRGTLFAVPFDVDTLSTNGTPEPVLEEVSYTAGQGEAQLDFSQTGTLVYRTGAQAGDLATVQWLDSAGKVQPLLPKPGLYSYPDLSPDGFRLALVASGASGDSVSVYDLKRDRLTPLMAGAGGYNQPLWTPDDRFIVARSSSGGVSWMRADGAGKPQPLIESKNVQYPRSITSDGRRLAFEEVARDTAYDIWTVNIESDGTGLRAGKPELFLQTRNDERDAASRRMGAGWPMLQTSRDSIMSTSRPFPIRAADGLCQTDQRAACTPCSLQTERSSFTAHRAIGSWW